MRRGSAEPWPGCYPAPAAILRRALRPFFPLRRNPSPLAPPAGLRELLRAEVVALVLLVAALFVAFSPVWQAVYGSADEFVFLRGDFRQNLEENLANGRPLLGLSSAVAFSFVRDPAGLRYLRGGAVAAIALAASAWYLLLRRRRLPVPLAFGTALGIFTLPPFLVQAAWGSMNIPDALGSLLGGGGALVAWSRRPGERSAAGRILRAAALLAISLAIYQPNSMAWWVVVLVLVLTEEGPIRFRRVAEVVVAFGLGVAGYVVFLWKPSILVVGSWGQRGTFTLHPVDKGLWFLGRVLPRAFDPWAFHARPAVAVATVVAIVAGLLLFLQGGARRRLGILALLLAALPAAYLPNLAAVESWEASRTLSALQPAAFVLAVFALFGFARRLPLRFLTAPSGRLLGITLPVLLLGILPALHGSRVLSVGTTVPAAREVAALRSAIAPVVAASPPRIGIVPAHWDDGFAPAVSFDEFGSPVGFASWTIEPLVRLVADEAGCPFGGEVIEVRSPGDPRLPPGTPVIDFGAVLRQARDRERSSPGR